MATTLPQTIQSRAVEKQRLISLDVFRGLTVAGMILVTDPGTYSAVYKPLLHAQWENPTATDMIFPSFLVIVGISIALAFATRLQRGSTRAELLRHVLQRSVLIFLLGLILNGFPDYNLHTLRIPGVLQRIAICYLLGATLYLAATKPKNRRQTSALIAITVVALLTLYWALLRFYPVPGFGSDRLDSLGNLGAYIDRAVFGIPHLWPYGTTPGYGVTFDPEGILSTLGSLVTLLFGVLAGEWLLIATSQARKAIGLTIAGAVLILIGLALNPSMPLIKKIWTPTFALLSSGVALLTFALLYFILDIKQWKRWSTPALIFGTNAILAFTLSGIITTLTDRIHITANDGTRDPLHHWAYQHLFATWLNPTNASLAYAITIV
ncbi:MAG TPA: heparan-alpha-glucosaminide N-acetyltransferase domain-containing protein, partial [Edaphobacter sp.]